MVTRPKHGGHDGYLISLKKHQIHYGHPHMQDESINISKAEGRIIKSMGDIPSKGCKGLLLNTLRVYFLSLI